MKTPKKTPIHHSFIHLFTDNNVTVLSIPRIFKTIEMLVLLRGGNRKPWIECFWTIVLNESLLVTLFQSDTINETLVMWKVSPSSWQKIIW